MKGSIFNRVKKSCMVAMLAAGMLLGATAGAQAVDFKAKGQWLVGFGLGDARLGSNGNKADLFGASQRFRVQLDAIASENLSGRLWFEIGNQDWGRNNNSRGGGGALGADGDHAIKVKNAFIDWIVPQTDLKLRMGIQNLYLPNAAGGSSVIGNTDVAGITASYQFNDMVGLTAFWYRPANDNYELTGNDNPRNSHYLDNMDLFGAAVPVTLDGFELTPWVMYGMLGRNTLRWGNNQGMADGAIAQTLFANPGGQRTGLHGSDDLAYSSMFWGGLPIKINAWDPLNVEFEFNYGYVQGFGDSNVTNYKTGLVKRADDRREGWLVKALVEYKLDWGVPGIFGWYASGDDGDVKNGSERMPSIKANGRFTSFMGAAGTDWWSNSKGSFNEKHTSYAGTWGIGAHIRDMSFLEDLKHTFRVAYWGGTNSPDMVKYFQASNDWNMADGYDGIYMTSNDGLLEFNLDNSYKVYENLTVNLDFGYIVNMMDRGTWKRSGSWAGGFNNWDKNDAWKTQLTFNYSF